LKKQHLLKKIKKRAQRSLQKKSPSCRIMETRGLRVFPSQLEEAVILTLDGARQE